MRVRALLLTLALAATTAAPVRPAAAAADPLETTQWNLARIHAAEGWDVTRGAGVIVAVVDSGVDPAHPELGSRLVRGASCIGAATPAGCNRSEAAWADANGHGTHVAGIIAAPRDGQGVVGVAPEARIMPVRVLDANGDGDGGDVAVGIDYAVANDADVINLSLGGLPVASQLTSFGPLRTDFSRAIEAAAAAGVLVVAAAGNDAFPICDHKVFRTGAGVCVGATDRRNLKAGYSNFGGGLDLVAPGGSGLPLCSEDVLSTYLASHQSVCTTTPGYEVVGGTSMAAPHASGVGALLGAIGVRGSAAAAQLAATAVDLGVPGDDLVYGSGLVDAGRAVRNQRSSSWRMLPG